SWGTRPRSSAWCSPPSPWPTRCTWADAGEGSGRATPDDRAQALGAPRGDRPRAGVDAPALPLPGDAVHQAGAHPDRTLPGLLLADVRALPGFHRQRRRAADLEQP